MKLKKSKSKPKSKPKSRVLKARGRQFYSEVSPKSAPKNAKSAGSALLKKSPKKATHKKASRSTTTTRELLAEISKVGKGIKRRVKRAL